MMLYDQITDYFQQRYDEAPSLIVQAPGRVNLIGEHTDYNDGFVLPMAIDRAVWIALRPRADRRVQVYSPTFGENLSFSLDHLRQNEEVKEGWGEYLKGVAWAMQEAGHELRGWEGIVVGDVPIGAGLSSSAALELATARAFAALSGILWDAPQMALLGQRAENQWVGVNCGIMDQMISATGQPGHALLIDCRSLESESVPLPSGNTVVVLDTATRRGLVGSAYNERRAQCEAAAHFFGVPALRDVSLEQFAAQAEELDEVTRRRARHIITENERTLHAAEAMRRQDAEMLGHLMDESHRSLRDDFEVSSPELNTMVDLARQHEGCYGARMTGAGFGGCAVALLRAENAPTFASRVIRQYEEATGLMPTVYLCQAAEGASIIVQSDKM
ncbi:MAG: galactokinase [Ardenticatenales bacterium]|nr:galactokinase [Ardenticatenales bacterium]